MLRMRGCARRCGGLLDCHTLPFLPSLSEQIVRIIDVILSAILRNDNAGNADYHGIVRDVARHDAVSANGDIVPDPHRSDNPGSGSDIYVVAEDGITLVAPP